MPPRRTPTVKPDPEPVQSESSNNAFETRKNELYDALKARGDHAIVYQSDFEGLRPNFTLQEMMELMQALTNADRLGLMQDSNGTTCWEVRSAKQAAAYGKLNREERMIFSHIEDSREAGIWTRTLQKRTNLHQQVINRALKALEASKRVKQIKSVKYPSRKIYMRYDLDPGEEVTGGPWFSDGELDLSLISLLSDVLVYHIQGESWRLGPVFTREPDDAIELETGEIENLDFGAITRASRYRPMVRKAHDKSSHSKTVDRILIPHPPGYQDYPTTSELLNWIESTSVLQGKDLLKADLERLLEMLCFDGRLEKVGKRLPSKTSSLRGRHDPMDTDESSGENDDGDEGDPTSRRDDGPEDMFRSVYAPYGETDFGPGNGLSEAPCGKCPVFRLCEQGGPVNASNCAYFGPWLEPRRLHL